MKFTLRDLFWLILLVAVASLAYRHEHSFKEAVLKKAARDNEIFVGQQRTELLQQEIRMSQRWRQYARDEIAANKSMWEEEYQKLKERQRGIFLPPTEQLIMPSVLPKDVH